MASFQSYSTTRINFLRRKWGLEVPEEDVVYYQKKEVEVYCLGLEGVSVFLFPIYFHYLFFLSLYQRNVFLTPLTTNVHNNRMNYYKCVMLYGDKSSSCSRVKNQVVSTAAKKRKRKKKMFERNELHVYAAILLSRWPP